MLEVVKEFFNDGTLKFNSIWTNFDEKLFADCGVLATRLPMHKIDSSLPKGNQTQTMPDLINFEKYFNNFTMRTYFQ